MIGRDDELRRGAELARDAAAGQGRLLLVQGEPGIGKTLLLRTILDEAAALLPHVVTGAADEFDQRLPFATLHSCLQPWGDPVDMGRHLRGLSVLIAVHRGDRKTAASQLAFLSGPAPATSPGRQSAHTPTWARALDAQADGDILAATAILRPVWDEDIERDQLRYLRHYLVPDLVALQLAVGDEAAARRTADSIRNYASRRTAPALRRSVQQAGAMAAGAAAKLLAVADEYQQARRPLFAAQARERAAVLLAAGGQARQAEDALRQAVGTYESLDARWDLARADSMLRTLGVRRGKKGPRRRPRSGWEAMTETERIVAGLVAEGLSNPQIGARMYLSAPTCPRTGWPKSSP